MTGKEEFFWFVVGLSVVVTVIGWGVSVHKKLVRLDNARNLRQAVRPAMPVHAERASERKKQLMDANRALAEIMAGVKNRLNMSEKDSEEVWGAMDRLDTALKELEMLK